jgi:hypothetical protein
MVRGGGRLGLGGRAGDGEERGKCHTGQVRGRDDEDCLTRSFTMHLLIQVTDKIFQSRE